MIEHGVHLPAPATYAGDLERGIVVVNHLHRRGRRLGADVFHSLRQRVPLDLVGMGAEEAGGIGEVGNLALPAFCARYRFFFNPIRYTSLGLAVVGLGGGRTRPQDAIDFAVGLTDLVGLGDKVEAGQPLAMVHARTQEAAEQAVREVVQGP